jgi:hypothetical protein
VVRVKYSGRGADVDVIAENIFEVESLYMLYARSF